MSSIMTTNEYITFTLGKEEYAIGVSSIESILEYREVTKLPGADSSIKGVLNLRGQALPVVDLRRFLNLTETEITQDTSIMVMFIESEEKISIIGGLVDSVKEVIEISPEMIQQAPKVGGWIKGDFISGIARNNDNFIIILDINKVLNDDLIAIAEDENLMLPDDLE